MNRENIYGILVDISKMISQVDSTVKALPETFEPSRSLSSLGLDIVTLPEIFDEMQSRLNGRDLKTQAILVPEILNSMSLGNLVDTIRQSITTNEKNPIVVYVDDEEENIFIFKRQFGKSLNLKTFTNPTEALQFIKSNEEVGLVITDEIMPGLRGNELCDEVQKVKPNMKFILITGNPNHDADLMYSSLRGNRFFDFLQKPVDFSARGGEILNMIQGIIHFSW